MQKTWAPPKKLTASIRPRCCLEGVCRAHLRLDFDQADILDAETRFTLQQFRAFFDIIVSWWDGEDCNFERVFRMEDEESGDVRRLMKQGTNPNNAHVLATRLRKALDRGHSGLRSLIKVTANAHFTLDVGDMDVVWDGDHGISMEGFLRLLPAYTRKRIAERLQQPTSKEQRPDIALAIDGIAVGEVVSRGPSLNHQATDFGRFPGAH